MKISRKTYKKIKKYNRVEMDKFLELVYMNGYKDGELGRSKFDIIELLIKVLPTVDGIGEKRTDDILMAVQSFIREEE